jgi:mRNA-degrading endonuclease RelE of RelBE toxin-antitoxin system
MTFKETFVFTKQIQTLLTDAEYREFQQELVLNPLAGSPIKGGGGLRKVRWKSAAGGKRGGIRVIYYRYVEEQEIYLLLAYGKTEKDDLSPKELGVLRKLVTDTF